MELVIIPEAGAKLACPNFGETCSRPGFRGESSYGIPAVYLEALCAVRSEGRQAAGYISPIFHGMALGPGPLHSVVFGVNQSLPHGPLDRESLLKPYVASSRERGLVRYFFCERV